MRPLRARLALRPQPGSVVLALWRGTVERSHAARATRGPVRWPAAPSRSPPQTPSALDPRTAMTRSPFREESLQAPRCLRAHQRVGRQELQVPCNRGCPSPLRAESSPPYASDAYVTSCVRHRLGVALDVLGESEIQDLDGVLWRHYNVGAFQITMHDAVLMRMSDRIRDLHAVTDDRLDRKPVGGNDGGEGPTLSHTPSR